MPQQSASEVLEAFQRYTEAFQALDARAVARHFHEPALFITPREIRALPTAAAVEQAYAQVMADLPPDYARTEFGPLSVHRLADDLAMVSGSGAWKTADNKDLMPFGMTYTLRLIGQAWRIVVVAIHAPDGGPVDDSGHSLTQRTENASSFSPFSWRPNDCPPLPKL